MQDVKPDTVKSGTVKSETASAIDSADSDLIDNSFEPDVQTDLLSGPDLLETEPTEPADTSKDTISVSQHDAMLRKINEQLKRLNEKDAEIDRLKKENDILREQLRIAKLNVV